jgi:hypothetical protein
MTRLTLALALVLALAPVALAQDQKAPKKEATERDTDAALKEALDERCPTFKADSAAPRDVIAALGDLARIDIVVDSSAAAAVDAKDAAVTFIATEITTKAVLEKLTTKLKLAYQVWHGAVWITAKDKPIKEEPEVKPSPGLKKRLDTQKLSLNLDGTKLSDVVDVLEQLTQQSFSYDASVKADDIKLTVRLVDQTVADALAIICRIAGLKLDEDQGLNVFKKAS